MSGQSSKLAREEEAIKQFLKTHHNLFLWELLASYAAQVRLEALEEAAKIVDNWHWVANPPNVHHMSGAIRGLAERAAGQEPG